MSSATSRIEEWTTFPSLQIHKCPRVRTKELNLWAAASCEACNIGDSASDLAWCRAIPPSWEKKNQVSWRGFPPRKEQCSPFLKRLTGGTCGRYLEEVSTTATLHEVLKQIHDWHKSLSYLTQTQWATTITLKSIAGRPSGTNSTRVCS